MPASIISSILIIPCIILALPLSILPNKTQTVGMRFLLRIQHTVSLSFWYFVQEYYLPDIIPIPFKLELINISHSILEANSVLITLGNKKIFHT